MNLTSVSNHTALTVTQVNKGRVLSLGRGLRAKSKLQSPLSKINSLRILQANMNGLSSYAMKVKLDHLLELADIHNAQIIAIQETKLQEQMKLNIKEFHINRLESPNRRGDGLALLIRDVKYQNIVIPPTSTDLEIQGVSFFWGKRKLNIFNMYHPPNQGSLPDSFLDLATANVYQIFSLETSMLSIPPGNVL
ncbi:hypothetical protein TNCV_4015531 [Trichonephila clavipes]|nr:hypothetical protein TNCV_4015531 [Trichonephila clavipes]